MDKNNSLRLSQPLRLKGNVTSDDMVLGAGPPGGYVRVLCELLLEVLFERLLCTESLPDLQGVGILQIKSCRRQRSQLGSSLLFGCEVGTSLIRCEIRVLVRSDTEPSSWLR